MAKTYAANRRKRQVENRKARRKDSVNANSGAPLGGEKSPATLARIARRSNTRMRNKQQTEMLAKLKADRQRLEAQETANEKRPAAPAEVSK